MRREMRSLSAFIGEPVNPSVVSSSLTGAAKPLESNISSGFFVLFFRFYVVLRLFCVLFEHFGRPEKGKWGKMGENLIVKFPDFL